MRCKLCHKFVFTERQMKRHMTRMHKPRPVWPHMPIPPSVSIPPSVTKPEYDDSPLVSTIAALMMGRTMEKIAEEEKVTGHGGEFLGAGASSEWDEPKHSPEDIPSTMPEESTPNDTPPHDEPESSDSSSDSGSDSSDSSDSSSSDSSSDSSDSSSGGSE